MGRQTPCLEVTEKNPQKIMCKCKIVWWLINWSISIYFWLSYTLTIGMPFFQKITSDWDGRYLLCTYMYICARKDFKNVIWLTYLGDTKCNWHKCLTWLDCSKNKMGLIIRVEKLSFGELAIKIRNAAGIPIS